MEEFKEILKKIDWTNLVLVLFCHGIGNAHTVKYCGRANERRHVLP